MKNLDDAFLLKKVSDIGSFSHKLKSTFALYQLDRIFNAFNEIEMSCYTKEALSEIEKKYNVIKPAILSVVKKLNKLKKEN
jgi:hypothetical protein